MNLSRLVLGYDPRSEEEIKDLIEQERLSVAEEEQSRQIITDKELIANMQKEQEAIQQIIKSAILKQQQEDNENKLAMIEFSMNKQGRVDIQCQWTEQSEKSEEALALLLYYVNSGAFLQACAQHMMDIGVAKQESQQFVLNSLGIWAKKREQDPIMKPSEVFANYQGPAQ